METLQYKQLTKQYHVEREFINEIMCLLVSYEFTRILEIDRSVFVARIFH